MDRDEKRIVRKTFLYGGLGFLGLVIVGGLLLPIGTILTAPGRVISDTLKTDNILSNYEMYYDLNASYTRRVSDIKSHRSAVNMTSDEREKNRLTVELLGMQHTCRDLVTRYNANSQKMNRNLFKSNNLPYELDIATCE